VTPTCSEVTRVEVLRGMRSHERRVTERFLATLNVRHFPMFPNLEPAYRR
jgi:hypothetical protein